MLPYAELHCVSNFSFLRGASHAEELVERAQALGYAALAVTDECSLAGVVRAHLAARGSSLALLIGAEFALHEVFAEGRPAPPAFRPTPPRAWCCWPRTARATATCRS
jgi:error-prone DNA polymerase